MGERLVVKVERDDILLATIYYHWSAYTETSAKILKNLYNHVLVNANQMSDDEIRLALIRFAEHSTSMGYVEDMTTLDRIQKERLAALDPSAPNYEFITSWIFKETKCHGGVSSDDRELVKSLFPNEIFLTENVSRNEGLVSVSEESMQSAIDWAESLATIDLTEETVVDNTFWMYSLEEYIEHLAEREEEYPDADVMEIKDIPESPIDVSEYPLSDSNVIYDIIISNKTGYLKYGETILEYIR